MKNYRCLLIDDEPPAVELLKKYVDLVPGLEVAATFHSAVDAFAFLAEEEVDLIFLDIRMPLLNGIDFLKTLNKPPAVILTTAYREYALDGYDLDIVDYLLKPIAFQRFLKAVNRFQTGKNAPKTISLDTEAQPEPAFLFFNVNKTHYKVFLQDILYLESLKDYVRVHTREDELVVKGNLGNILERLPKLEFIRIHRSFAVNISKIKAFNQAEVEIAGERLPLGGTYREEFKEAIEKL